MACFAVDVHFRDRLRHRRFGAGSIEDLGLTSSVSPMPRLPCIPRKALEPRPQAHQRAHIVLAVLALSGTSHVAPSGESRTHNRAPIGGQPSIS